MDAEVPVTSALRPAVATAMGPAQPNVRLVVVTGRAIGRSIEVPGPRFLIGRDPTCHLRPNNVAVSRVHATIEQRKGRVYLRDLGTTNGTFLNDRLLRDEEAEVAHGDRLEVGPLKFTFFIDA